MKIKILLMIWLCTLLIPPARAEVLLEAAAGTRYLPQDTQILPEVSLQGQADFYKPFSEYLTVFMESQLYTVCSWQEPVPIFAALTLAPDLSYLKESFLGRWGLQADLKFTGPPASRLYNLGSWLELCLSYNNLTVKFRPAATYYSTGRIRSSLESGLSLAFTIHDRMILTPGLAGTIHQLYEGTPEGSWQGEVEIDWYPGTRLIIYSLLGYEIYFSSNSSTLTYNTMSMIIPDYYAFHRLYGKLEGYWMIGRNTSLNFNLLLSFKLKEHGAVQFPVPAPEPEWQFTLAPELQLDFCLSAKFTLSLAADLHQVFSNTDYENITDAGGAVKLVYSF